MRIDRRRDVKTPPNTVYAQYTFEYKVAVAEAVLRGRISSVLKWKKPPPRSNAYRWAKTMRDEGYHGLLPKSRRPHTVHKALEYALERAEDLRVEHGWSARKIKAQLEKEGITIGESTIQRDLKKKELNNPIRKPRKQHKWVRWERDHSNSLWQMDWKWVEDKTKWLLAIIDDHSRYIVGARYFESATTDNALELLDEAIAHHGTPREVLTDRGTQFYNNLGETCKFLEHMKSKKVDHIFASIKKPTTCGKLERFWGTHNKERWGFPNLKKFLHYYNFERPHMSLAYLTPYEVYVRDMKV